MHLQVSPRLQGVIHGLVRPALTAPSSAGTGAGRGGVSDRQALKLSVRSRNLSISLRTGVYLFPMKIVKPDKSLPGAQLSQYDPPAPTHILARLFRSPQIKNNKASKLGPRW